MTAEHRSQLVVGNPSGLQGSNSRALARLHGRGATLFESASGTIGVVAPWPHSTDTNGQAYPSGLLGVSFTKSALFTAAGFNASAIAVPETLPGGYLPRVVRDNANGYGQDSSRGQYAPFALASYSGAFCTGWKTNGSGADQSPRIRNTATLESYPFFPENLADNGFHFNSVNRDGPGAYLMGLRYLKSRVVYTGIFDPFYYDYGQFQIVRWTNPATVMTPDPTTGLFPVDATLWTSPHITADYNTGFLYDVIDLDFKAPTGTRALFASFFTLHTAATNPADPPNIWRFPTTPFISAVEHWWGPRLDIPLPFTVFGEGANVAPGGVVSGILTGY